MKIKAIVPQLTYYTAEKTIEWLCQALGFEKHLIVSDENGQITHAELVLNNNMIMIGPANPGSELNKYIKHPQDVEGAVTQSPYVVLDSESIKHHYERAVENGARILHQLREEGYGGKHYSCYDPEGHLWSFGTYDPWVKTI